MRALPQPGRSQALEAALIATDLQELWSQAVAAAHAAETARFPEPAVACRVAAWLFAAANLAYAAFDIDRNASQLPLTSQLE